MTLLSTVYCTVNEVERKMSADGVRDASDHDQDGTTDVDVVDDSINQATVEMDIHLRQRYDQATLAADATVNLWARTIAAYFLFQNRGNPVPNSLQNQFDRLMDLDNGLIPRIGKGLNQLGDSALRDDLRPTMSNLTIDRRWRRSTVRVTEENSSDPPTKLTKDPAVRYPDRFR